MNILLLKLILTPTLIGAATLAGRRWGAGVSGWIVGLPLTSGPVALFLALERGVAFASHASQGIILGLLSVAVFCLAYSRLALRASWFPSMLMSWLAFSATTLTLQRITLPLTIAFVGVVFVLAVVFKLLRARGVSGIVTRPPCWDVPARMIIATAFVVLLTALAGVLGPRLSGLVAPFPVFGTILAVFTHRLHGAAAASDLLRGVVLGSFSFATFFFVVALMIERAGILAAFICAIVAALALHVASLQLLRKT